MSIQIYKLLLFFKRRQGMSFEAFKEYYENVHVKLAGKHLAGVCQYVRRYVRPSANPDGRIGELDFDVVTEVWFNDRSMFEKVMELSARGEMPPDIIADQEQFLDRGKTRGAVVVAECDFEPLKAGPPSDGPASA